MKILLIEDDLKIAQALGEGLAHESYEVAISHTGEDGFFRLSNEKFDVVILDWMLPGRSGIEILAAMRQRGDATKVLILTARDEVDSRVQGLDSGADDYLVKPFAFPELLARIRVLARRSRAEETTKLRCADLEVDMLTRAVSRGATAIELTIREFDLLTFLMRNRGHIVSREMIARDVWHEPTRITPIDNVIDVHITRLRRKIDEPFPKKLLKTVRGVGFTLDCVS